MMAVKFTVLVLLFIVGYSYASPLRMASVYDPPLFAVPIFVQDLDEPQDNMEKEPMYALNDDSKAAEDTFDIEKRSAEKTDDDDLETAAGTNVLRPLFVYRQQVAYRQRARNAVRRGRRI